MDKNMLKMLEDAKALSSIFGNNTEGEKESSQQEGNSFDINKMLQLFEIMQLFSSKAPTSKSENNDYENISHNEYENINNNQIINAASYSPNARVLKASLPYLNKQQQKAIHLYIKMLEINMFMDSFDKKDCQSLQDDNINKNMLEAISEELPHNMKHKIESITKIMSLSEKLNKKE